MAYRTLCYSLMFKGEDCVLKQKYARAELQKYLRIKGYFNDN